MFGKRFERQKPRKVVQPRTMNRPIEALENLLKISVAPPLELVHLPCGPLIRLAAALVGVFPAVSTSAIDPAISGAPGTGAATLTTYTGGGSGTLGTGVAVDVLNFWTFTQTGQTYTLASGKPCLLFKWVGQYWLIVGQC